MKKKIKPPLPSYNVASPEKRDAKSKLYNQRTNYHLARIDQLKIKMSLQTKNLKTLTSHQDRMSEIYNDDKANAQNLGYARPQM